MKLSRAVLMGLVVSGAIVLLSSISFAAEDNEKDQIKVLNDATAALKQSNPDLSVDLTKYANEEANEMNEKKEEKKELEGKNEEAMEKEHKGHIKLLRDSATALQKSNPELAESLIKMADRSAERMEEKKEGKEDTDEMEENEMKDKK